MILAIQMVIALLVGAFIVIPLFQAEKTGLAFQAKDPLQEGLARKEVLLKELKEIDLDYQTGKLSVADYQELTSRYKQQTAEIIQKIDQLRGGQDLCLPCKKKVPTNAKFCPFCGRRVS